MTLVSRTIGGFLVVAACITGCTTHENPTNRQINEVSEKAELLRACEEVGKLDVEFGEKDLYVIAIDGANKKVMDKAEIEVAQGKIDRATAMRQLARDKTKEHLPDIREAISSLPRIQKDLESKSFSNSLPVEAREILNAYSKATAHFVELETTRALAMSAFAERGDLAPIKSIYKFDDTYSKKLHEDYQPIKEAFSKLCFSDQGK